MSELYETKYGICNHPEVSRQRPLSGVEFHDCQDVNEVSGIKKVVQSYVDNNIRQDYGFTLLEFMDLPIDITQMLVTMSEERKSKKQSMVNSVIKETEKEFSKFE